MSEAPAFPRLERSWPTGAFVVALGGGLGSLAGSAALVASADSVGRATKLVLVFALLACVEGALCVDAVRPWLRGSPVMPRTWLLQVGVAILVLASFTGGAAMGGAACLGVLAGVLLPAASAIRYSRLDSDLVGHEDERLTQTLASSRPRDEETPKVPATRTPQVGPVLRETVAVARDRALAWAAATAVAAGGSLAAGMAGPVVLGMVLLGAVALAWVYRRLLRMWFALRDFESVATEPHHAFVIVLSDPRPGVTRPLLGMWSEEPLPVEGRLPRAEAVYRCEAGWDALVSVPAAVVVHEAWVDSGPNVRSGRRSVPRWVAADSGLALPARQVVLGSRYLASIVDTERPARARSLTMPAPNPTTETATASPVRAVTEPRSGTGRWARLFASRLVALAAVGVLLDQWRAWFS